MQNHPFFEGVEWDDISDQTPPYHPPELVLPEAKLVSLDKARVYGERCLMCEMCVLRMALRRTGPLPNIFRAIFQKARRMNSGTTVNISCEKVGGLLLYCV